MAYAHYGYDSTVLIIMIILSLLIIILLIVVACIGCMSQYTEPSRPNVDLPQFFKMPVSVEICFNQTYRGESRSGERQAQTTLASEMVSHVGKQRNHEPGKRARLLRTSGMKLNVLYNGNTYNLAN